jgi:acetolactate synthase-1/2/3 large subunit
LVSLPEDVLWEEASTAPAAPVRPPAGSVPTSEVQAVLRRIGQAERPIIVAGAGVVRSAAVEALRDLAERTGVPVVAAWRRPDAFPNDHPLYLGMTGPGAPDSVLERLKRADLLLAIGTRLSQMTTFGYQVPAPDATIVVVDHEAPAWLGDRTHVSSSACTFIRECLQSLNATPWPGTEAGERNAADRYEFERQLARRPEVDPSALVHPYEFVRHLQFRLSRVSVLTTDAGDFGWWAARYLQIPSGSTSFLGPSSGTMGFAIPAAIGGSLARPGDLAVALVGDGGAGMSLFELETAVRENANLLVVVFDNQRYGTIRTLQEARSPGKVAATDLGPVDFAAAGRALGATAFRADRSSDVGPTLDRALAAPGVRLLHLRCDPESGRPS